MLARFDHAMCLGTIGKREDRGNLRLEDALRCEGQDFFEIGPAVGCARTPRVRRIDRSGHRSGLH
jgi:hypothetical protein